MRTISSRDLDQVGLGERLQQAPGFDQRARVGRLDLPALGNLAPDELGVGIGQEAVVGRATACLLDAA